MNGSTAKTRPKELHSTTVEDIGMLEKIAYTLWGPIVSMPVKTTIHFMLKINLNSELQLVPVQSEFTAF